MPDGTWLVELSPTGASSTRRLHLPVPADDDALVVDPARGWALVPAGDGARTVDLASGGSTPVDVGCSPGVDQLLPGPVAGSALMMGRCGPRGGQTSRRCGSRDRRSERSAGGAVAVVLTATAALTGCPASPPSADAPPTSSSAGHPPAADRAAAPVYAGPPPAAPPSAGPLTSLRAAVDLTPAIPGYFSRAEAAVAAPDGWVGLSCR